MSKFAVVFAGPWRAVVVLGVTQILAWGTMFYTPVLMLPRLAADRGFTATFAMAGFSAGLLVAGFVARYVGILIDRYGGHRVMPAGSLLGALGLVGLTYAGDASAYFAVWMVLGVAMAASLYDPAFATLGRIFGARARRPITVLTLAGGFASTVSWPATQTLLDALGWRGTYLVYAALLAGVAAPLHWLALPRRRAEPEMRPAGSAEPAPALFPANSRAFVLVAAAFAAYAFVPSGLSAHLLAIFSRHGIDPGTVVVIGALFGPSQVAARICELALARNLHPLWVVRFALSVLVAGFALLALFGFSVAAAAAFAILFGAANGLVTIARGTVPLALFGAAGYGRLIGRIAGPSLLMQGVAPLVLAFVAERGSDPMALLLAAGLTLIALACFVALRRPGNGNH
ncbi:MAG TPA: MFS transporter [Xanthobacteraceae bacterium]|nr:MFS transporter [Xanthobacteraceae bacterium]